MKLTKFVIVAGAVIALLSFFLPLASAHVLPQGGMKGIDFSLSPMDIVKGLSKLDDVVSGDAKNQTSEQAKKTVHDLEDSISSIKGLIALLYAPALLLLVIGGVGAARKKLGRLGGLGALFFGGLAGGIGALFLAAAGGAGAEIKPGLGTYLMLAGGLIGALAGLVTLVKPDRGTNW